MPWREQYAKIKRVEASILARSGVSSSTWRTAQSSGKGSSRASRRRGATWGVGQRDAYQRKEVGSGLRSRWFLLRPSGDHRRRRLEAAGFASSCCGRRRRRLSRLVEEMLELVVVFGGREEKQRQQQIPGNARGGSETWRAGARWHVAPSPRRVLAPPPPPASRLHQVTIDGGKF